MPIRMTARTWLNISLTINMLFASLYFGRRIYTARIRRAEEMVRISSVPESWADIYNRGRTSVYSIVPVNKGDVVFVGNSLAEGFPASELFHSLKVKSRGIGYNSTAHLLARLPGILAAEPAKAFIEIGINDIHTGVPMDTMMAHYDQMLDLFATSHTTPYIQSLMPVYGTHRCFSDSVIRANKKIKALCDRRHVAFVDLYPLLQDSTLFYDGLHLNGPGYLVWKKTIDSMVIRPAGLQVQPERLSWQKPVIAAGLDTMRRVAAR